MVASSFLVVLAGCSTSLVEESNRVWFEAEAGTNARVISQGPGEPMLLACDVEADGGECTWTVRLMLRSLEPLSQWSLDVTAVGDGVRIDDVRLVPASFDNLSDVVAAGAGRSLLIGAGASSDSLAGVEPGQYVLMEFTLTYTPQGDAPSTVEITAVIGEDGWLRASGEAAQVAFGDSLGDASAGRTVPSPMIILNPSVDPEICDDGVDNDGDGLTDCADPDCASQVACEDVSRVVCPEDVTVECDGTGHTEQLEEWLASADLDGPCADPNVTNDFDGLDPTCGSAGSATVIWKAAETCGSAECIATFTIEDTTPPVVQLEGPGEITLECGVDAYDEFGAIVDDECDPFLTDVEIGGDVVDVRSPGRYEVRYLATDDCGNESEELVRVVEVVDTLPPELRFDEVVELWPPNHDYVTLNLSDCIKLVDACEGEIEFTFEGSILSIYSDEPENSNGDGNTMDDIVIVSDTEFMVRAERRGGGNGRVYGVSFEVLVHQVDQRIEGTCLITVPHDQSGDPAIDDGPAAGYSVGG